MSTPVKLTVTGAVDTVCQSLCPTSSSNGYRRIGADVSLQDATSITPATGQREIDLLKDAFKIEDNWPVYCEEFKQWVLEDKFTLGRPALEKVA